MVLGVEVVDGYAHPAGDQHQDAADKFSNQGDGFLENVDDGQDGQDKTCNVKNGSKHSVRFLGLSLQI